MAGKEAGETAWVTQRVRFGYSLLVRPQPCGRSEGSTSHGFVFTPNHGSWLNQIEIWFGILTRSALRYRSFDDVSALTDAIYKFMEHWNALLAHPFEWTYTGKVLAA